MVQIINRKGEKGESIDDLLTFLFSSFLFSGKNVVADKTLPIIVQGSLGEATEQEKRADIKSENVNSAKPKETFFVSENTLPNLGAIEYKLVEIGVFLIIFSVLVWNRKKQDKKQQT